VKLVFGNELRIEKKNLSYHELKELVEKLVDKGYRFMRIVTEGYKRVYKVEWKDVLAILESPVIREYKLKKETS
jgi:predicted transcriptional regulator